MQQTNEQIKSFYPKNSTKKQLGMKPTSGKKNPKKNHSYQSTSTEKGIGYETQIRKKTNKIILPKEFYPEKQLDMKPISEKNQTQIIPPKEFDKKASGYETHITKKKTNSKSLRLQNSTVYKTHIKKSKPESSSCILRNEFDQRKQVHNKPTSAKTKTKAFHQKNSIKKAISHKTQIRKTKPKSPNSHFKNESDRKTKWGAKPTSQNQRTTTKKKEDEEEDLRRRRDWFEGWYWENLLIKKSCKLLSRLAWRPPSTRTC